MPKRGQFHAAIRVTPKRCESCVQGALGKRTVSGGNFCNSEPKKITSTVLQGEMSPKFKHQCLQKFLGILLHFLGKLYQHWVFTGAAPRRVSTSNGKIKLVSQQCGIASEALRRKLSTIWEEPSMDQCQCRGKLYKNFQDHWSIRISSGKRMDQ